LEKLKDFYMTLVVKNVQSMLEKFEETLEKWAKKVF